MRFKDWKSVEITKEKYVKKLASLMIKEEKQRINYFPKLLNISRFENYMVPLLLTLIVIETVFY